MQPHRIGLQMVIVGALCQAAGLGIDVWLHAADPDLAAREGLITFTNAGHVLLMIGIALVVVGAVLILLASRLAPHPALAVGVPVTLLVLLGGGTVVAAESSLGRGHDHGDEAAASPMDDGHHHASTTTSTPPDGGPPATGLGDQIASELAAHGHGNGEVPNVAIDAATRDAVAAQLVEAREVAARYPTVADAEGAGYRMITPYIPLIGAHYIRFDRLDDTFAIAEPEMLLYDGTDSGSEMVGLSYYHVGDAEPDGFAGPNDHWHRHIGLCIKDGVVVGGEQLSASECLSRGGFKVDGSDGWMVHAWVVPGWESQQGVFSAENADLR